MGIMSSRVTSFTPIFTQKKKTPVRPNQHGCWWPGTRWATALDKKERAPKTIQQPSLDIPTYIPFINCTSNKSLAQLCCICVPTSGCFFPFGHRNCRFPSPFVNGEPPEIGVVQRAWDVINSLRWCICNDESQWDGNLGGDVSLCHLDQIGRSPRPNS